MSIILKKFNFADLVAARPVREGRHLSCWGGGCFELQGSASCCWFHFPYLKGWRRPSTWKAPEKKQAARRLLEHPN